MHKILLFLAVLILAGCTNYYAFNNVVAKKILYNNLQYSLIKVNSKQQLKIKKNSPYNNFLIQVAVNSSNSAAINSATKKIDTLKQQIYATNSLANIVVNIYFNNTSNSYTINIYAN